MFVVAEPGFLQKLFKKVDTVPAVSRVVVGLERMVAERGEFEEPMWSER